MNLKQLWAKWQRENQSHINIVYAEALYRLLTDGEVFVCRKCGKIIDPHSKTRLACPNCNK